MQGKKVVAGATKRLTREFNVVLDVASGARRVNGGYGAQRAVERGIICERGQIVGPLKPPQTAHTHLKWPEHRVAPPSCGLKGPLYPCGGLLRDRRASGAAFRAARVDASNRR